MPPPVLDADYGRWCQTAKLQARGHGGVFGHAQAKWMGRRAYCEYRQACVRRTPRARLNVHRTGRVTRGSCLCMFSGSSRRAQGRKSLSHASGRPDGEATSRRLPAGVGSAGAVLLVGVFDGDHRPATISAISESGVLS